MAKLLYCRSCQDLVKLQPTKRSCKCGKSAGMMVSGTMTDQDGHNANIYGRYAEVVGVGDRELMHALRSPDLEPTVYGLGPDLKAWIYSHCYEKITRSMGGTERS